MSEMLLQAPVESYDPAPVAVAESMPAPPFQGDRKAEVMRVAVECYSRKPDWVTFFREILGVTGVVRRMFPAQEQITEFEKSEQYAEIQQMITKLREQPTAMAEDKEPTRVITVRMPKSLHEFLREEAQGKRTSMNQLCISKLLQVIDAELIPAD